MDKEAPFFLPSEIARLVLGYLEDEGYSTTCRSFMKECIHLQEYLALLKRGRQYPLTINGFTLIQMIEKFAQFYLVDTNRQTQGLGALWNQLESITACLKRQTSLKNFRVEGKSQNSRTRRANVMARLEIDEAGDNKQSNGAGHQCLSRNVKNPSSNVERNQPSSISGNIRNISGEISSPSTAINAKSDGKSIPASSNVGITPAVLLITTPSQSPNPVIQSRSNIKSQKLLAPKSSDSESVPKNSSTDISNSSCAISKSKINSDSKGSTQNTSCNATTTIDNDKIEVHNSDVHENEEAGFLDEEEMGCASHLSPSPALKNDDVKENSADGAKLSVCDQISKENLTRNGLDGRENLICDKTQKSCQNIGHSKDDLTMKNNIAVIRKQSTHVESPIVIVTGSESVTDVSTLSKENLNPCEPVENGSIVTEGRSHIQVTAIVHQSADLNSQNQESLHPSMPQLVPGEKAPEQRDSTVPSTPKKGDSKIGTALKTPVKNLREFGFKGQGKSPRRKRPPKRKSQGEKAAERRSSLPALNDSSNSNEGSLHENSFPTQLIEQLLNNPLLHERLAENINKTINCSDFSKSQNLSSTSIEQDTSQKSGPTTPKPSTNLEDILDPHETQMTEDQINDIIELTKQENVFDSLFKIFNHDATKEMTVSTSHLAEHSQEQSKSAVTTDTSTEFRPINSAGIGVRDFVPSFSSESHAKEKSFENKYVTEESINAVLNFYPSQGRTLHTPTDFSSLSSFVTLTSTSSGITPTVTISTSSNGVQPLVSTTVTSTVQSGSVASFQESSARGLQQECTNNVTSSTMCSNPKETYLPGTLTRDEVDAAVSVLSEKSLSMSSASNLSSQPSQCNPVDTSQNQSLHISAESNRVSRSTPYLTFVRDVSSSDNSSTPVGQRSSPMTVQIEDNADTFHGLPSEVKQLYSSFEENMTDVVINEQTTESFLPGPKTRSAKKINKTPFKKSPKKEKFKKARKGAGKSPKSTKTRKPSSNLNNSYRSPDLPAAIENQGKDQECEVSPTGSTSSKQSTSPKDGKTKSKKLPPVSKLKENKSSPRPLIRCDPLQPRINNKKVTSTSNNKATSALACISDSASKWSAGLSALIKIASPEKEKPDSTSTATPSGKKKRLAVTQASITPKTSHHGHSTTCLTPSGNGNITKSLPSTPFSGHSLDHVVPYLGPGFLTPSPESAKSNRMVNRSVSLSKVKKNLSSKTITSSQKLITVNEKPVEDKETGVIKLGPSCLGFVVKVDNQKGDKAERELIVPAVKKLTPKNTSPNQRTILPKPSIHDQVPLGVLCTASVALSKDEGNHQAIIASPNNHNAVSSERISTEVSSITQNGEPLLSMPMLDLGNSQDYNLPQPAITSSYSIQGIKNNINKPYSAAENSVSAQSTPSRSKYDDMEYTENCDFLDSPSKNKTISHSSELNTGGSLIRDAFEVACSSVDDSPDLQDQNDSGCTSQPLSDGKTHVNKMYIATPLHSIVASQNVQIKPSNLNQIGLVQCKQNQGADNQKQKRYLRKSVKIRRGLAKNLNSFTRPTVVERTGSDSLNQSNDLFHPKSMAFQGSGVNENASKILNFESLDGPPTNSVEKIKDQSVYGPLSETESDNDLGRNSPSSSRGEKTPAPWETADDFIPDAAGNVHLKNGVVKKIEGSNSSEVIGSIDQDSRGSSAKHVYVIGQDTGHLESQMQTSVKTFQQNYASERYNISPSCQKLIGQLGVTLQSDRLLGQAINTHYMVTLNQNDTSSPKPVCSVPLPNVVDLHLMRESSCDTNSELEEIYNSAQKNQNDKEQNTNKTCTVSKNCAGSEISNDSSDIDVEGDWENPWKSVSQEGSSVLNSPCSTTMNSTAIEMNLNETKTPEKVSGSAIDSEQCTSISDSGNKSHYRKGQSKDQGKMKSPEKESPTSVHNRFLMSPPKKRVTASMKCGSGLYFVSTSSQSGKTQKNVNAKKTPKKMQTISTPVRQSPRIAASPKGAGRVLQGSVEKVKKNLKIREGTDTVQPGCKRPREESVDEQKEQSKSKARKVKTPVDLTSLNVDKFLTKLYKK